MNMSPSFYAKMQIRSLERCKSGAWISVIYSDRPQELARIQEGDKAIDIIIEYWQKLIDAGDEAAIQKALDNLHAAQRRQEEDDILAQADEIRAARA